MVVVSVIRLCHEGESDETSCGFGERIDVVSTRRRPCWAMGFGGCKGVDQSGEVIDAFVSASSFWSRTGFPSAS